MPHTKELRINLFGNFRLTFENQPVVSLQTERYQSLLAYLLLNARSPIPRSQVAALFWPDLLETKSKTSFRRALYKIKQALPEPDSFLKVTNKTVQWSPQLPFWLDVTEFEAKLEQATQQPVSLVAQAETLKQAVALYEGDLLITCYDDWISSKRDYLHRVMVNTLTRLSCLLRDLEAYEEAIAYTQQLLQLEPLNEAAYLKLMRLYVLQSDRASALQIYHQCVTSLNEEMGITPSAQIRQFYENLLEDMPLSQSVSKPSLFQQTRLEQDEKKQADKKQADWGEAPDIQSFSGRKKELTQLSEWVQQDRCRLLTVLGIGGIGKTALAAKVAYETQESFDFVVWRSLRNAPPLNALLEELIPALSSQQDSTLSIARLVHWLRQSRCLIILDNVETLFKGGERAGQYLDGYENYSELLSVVGQASHQSCLLLTSREIPPEIATFSGESLAIRVFQLDGSAEVSLTLMDVKQLKGSPTEKKNLCNHYGCNPLSVQIVSSSIQDVFGGNITLFLAENTLMFTGVKRLLDLQFERLTPLERTIMIWLAINRDWTSFSQLSRDIYPSCQSASIIEAIESLCWRSLLERREGHYTQQPVIMEYVTNLLTKQVAEDLATPARFEERSRIPASAIAQYPLIKTTEKDFIRESQERLLLKSVAEQLTRLLPNSAKSIREYFQTLKSPDKAIPSGYSVGNLINLGWALKADFTGLDFSQLSIQQADFQNIDFHQVNCTQTTFKNTTFHQPLGPIFTVAYNPDGTLIATGEGNGQIVLWRVADQTPLLIFEKVEGWLVSIDFSHDGKYLLSEGNNHQLNVWQVETGQIIRALDGHTEWIWTINTSPQENWVVSGSINGSLILSDFVSGQQLHQLTGHTQKVYSAAFSPDGQFIASVSVDKTIRIWSTTTGHVISHWPCEVEPQVVSFSPNGKCLAVGNEDGSIHIWNIHQEKINATLQAHDQWLPALAFSPCGNYIMSGSADGTTKLWDAKSHQLLRTTASYESWVWGIAFHPSSQSVAVVSSHTVRLLELPTKRPTKLLQGYSSWVWAIAFHPSQPLLASGNSDAILRLWNTETGQLIKAFQGHDDWVNAVDFSPCGTLIASGCSEASIRLWDIETGKTLKILKGHGDLVTSVNFSPDGKQLLSGSFDKTMRLWSVTTGQEMKTINAHDGWVLSAQFSPNDKYLASSSIDGSVKLWDATTGEVIFICPDQSETVWDLKFSPDSTTLVTGGEDSVVKLWNTETKSLTKMLTAEHLCVNTVAISPDGRFVASGSDSKRVCIWESQTGQLLQALDLHEGRIDTLSFSSDSQRLASGSNDETIRVWDVSSGNCLMVLRPSRPYENMMITDVMGLTAAQKASLLVLGAVE